MLSKPQAIEFAKQQYQWTAKDAERAFESIDWQDVDERVLLTAMAAFAGKELLNRQRLQAAQKGQVTKKTKYIKEIELDFANKVNEFDAIIKKERSLFVGVIANLYNVAKRFGMRDPWMETLLSQYEEYLSNESEEDAA